MTKKLFNKIFKILGEIPIEYVGNDKEIFAYDIYLISNGFRPGGFLFDRYPYNAQLYKISNLDWNNRGDYFNDFEFKKYTEPIYNLLNKINTIDNIGVYIGALFVGSRNKDTIYIYNKNDFKSKLIRDNIKWLEQEAQNRYNKGKSVTNIVHEKIGEILGFNKIKFNFKNYIKIFICINNLEIYNWWCYDTQLKDLYKRLKQINNILEPLNKKASLIIKEENYFSI